MRPIFTPPAFLSSILWAVLRAPIYGFRQISVVRSVVKSNGPPAGSIPPAKDLVLRCLNVRRLSIFPSSLLIGLIALVVVSQAAASPRESFQSTAVLEGRVVDQHGAIVPGAKIMARHDKTGVERTGESDSHGNYQIAALVVGSYRVEVRAGGFKTKIIEKLDLEVGRIVVQDFDLEVGDISEMVVVTTITPVVERATTSVGHVVDQRTVQDIPLNGRFFLDLGLLVPGSVTPPQNGFAAVPVRGSGAFSINTRLFKFRPCRWRRPSYEKKKKVFCLIIGPPRLPPN